jgi:hypothetical protein
MPSRSMAGHQALDLIIVVRIHGGQCGSSVIDSTVGFQPAGPVQLRGTALRNNRRAETQYIVGSKTHEPV